MIHLSEDRNTDFYWLFKTQSDVVYVVFQPECKVRPVLLCPNSGQKLGYR